jgi:hypothetical protein
MAFEKKKSTTKYLKVRGKVSYAKLYEPDDFRGEKKWKLNLYPSVDTILMLKQAGLQNKFKDDDGEKSGVTGKYLTFSRPCQKEFRDGITKFLPPEILNDKGDKIVWYEETKDGVEMHGDRVLIGNGSEIEIDLAVYQTQRFGAGSRFNSVKIIDLIEYNPPEEVSENEVDSVGEEVAPAVADVKPEAKPTRKSSKVTW